MPSPADPMAVIAGKTPAFSDAEAIRIAADHYGLQVTVRSLVSERDQNFHVSQSNGQQYVLKTANQSEDPIVTDFQIEALLHIENHIELHGTPIRVPVILRTLQNKTKIVVEREGASHVVRVVSYVDGMPIGDRLPSHTLCANMGVYLAYLGISLREFRHPGSEQVLLWDVQRALDLRGIVHHIPNTNVRADVNEALDAFEIHVVPNIGALRRQVVHSDFNPDNVLTDSSDASIVAGVIDFGDMLAAPLIADLAIAASYLRPATGDPLALISEMIAGYASVVPLQPAEVDVLFEFVKARLCASVAILYWRASFRDRDDPYLEKLLRSESSAETCLARLAEVSRDHAVHVFREVCALQDSRR